MGNSVGLPLCLHCQQLLQHLLHCSFHLHFCSDLIWCDLTRIIDQIIRPLLTTNMACISLYPLLDTKLLRVWVSATVNNCGLRIWSLYLLEYSPGRITVSHFTILQHKNFTFDCSGSLLSGVFFALISLLWTNSTLNWLADLVCSVSYNRQPDSVEVTFSKGFILCFICALYRKRFQYRGNQTSSNSITTEVCILIVDVA
jgi:hypothetical protein